MHTCMLCLFNLVGKMKYRLATEHDQMDVVILQIAMRYPYRLSWLLIIWLMVVAETAVVAVVVIVAAVVI